MKRRFGYLVLAAFLALPAGLFTASRAHAQFLVANSYQYITVNTTTTGANQIEVNPTAGNITVLINGSVAVGTPFDVYVGANGGATNATLLNCTTGTVNGSTKSLATAFTHYRFVLDGSGNLVGG